METQASKKKNGVVNLDSLYSIEDVEDVWNFNYCILSKIINQTNIGGMGICGIWKWHHRKCGRLRDKQRLARHLQQNNGFNNAQNNFIGRSGWKLLFCLASSGEEMIFFFRIRPYNTNSHSLCNAYTKNNRRNVFSIHCKIKVE